MHHSLLSYTCLAIWICNTCWMTYIYICSSYQKCGSFFFQKKKKKKLPKIHLPFQELYAQLNNSLVKAIFSIIFERVTHPLHAGNLMQKSSPLLHSGILMEIQGISIHRKKNNLSFEPQDFSLRHCQ